MTQFSQERHYECSEYWGPRGELEGLFVELSHRVWRPEWKGRCHHPHRARKCSSWKTAECSIGPRTQQLSSALRFWKGTPPNGPEGKARCFSFPVKVPSSSYLWIGVNFSITVCTNEEFSLVISKRFRCTPSAPYIFVYSRSSEASQRHAAVGEFK